MVIYINIIVKDHLRKFKPHLKEVTVSKLNTNIEQLLKHSLPKAQFHLNSPPFLVQFLKRNEKVVRLQLKEGPKWDQMSRCKKQKVPNSEAQKLERPFFKIIRYESTTKMSYGNFLVFR